ncbi:MAG: COX15/CtaA family protein [Proteobacteria bacterium]|nr:COX15/CtaA family protein [Pseudomonadota bacterium]
MNRLSFASIVLALCVILLGAYTRLSDAGLGCPDWPGCYGQLTAPSTQSEITAATQAFPTSPVDIQKAQIEMTHRYFAQGLGCAIFILTLLAFIQRKNLALPWWLGSLLLTLVLFQGILGMWTVTLKLLPIVVLSHLMGGFCTLSLLWLIWLFLKFPTMPAVMFKSNLSKVAVITLLILIVQICLGGWTSANFAALICPDFPLCQGQWVPPLDLQAFNLFAASSQGLAWMDSAEKTTIHFFHRLGALFTFTLGLYLSFQLWRQSKSITIPKIKRLFVGTSHLLATLLFIQGALGISNIVLHLPLAVAVAHNGIAALLLLVLVTINYMLFKVKPQHA